MAEEVDFTFCKVFSGISSAKSVRLIPSHIFTTANPDVIPVHQLSEALATAVQPGVDAPVVTPAPGSKGSQALAPMSSLAHHSETPPLPPFPCQMFPILVHPQQHTHLWGSLSIPSPQNGITPPIVHPKIDLGTGPMPKLSKPAVGAATHRTAKNCPVCHQST